VSTVVSGRVGVLRQPLRRTAGAGVRSKDDL
jgi:hypothetical protein